MNANISNICESHDAWKTVCHAVFSSNESYLYRLMKPFSSSLVDRLTRSTVSRREMLKNCAGGLGALALNWLTAQPMNASVSGASSMGNLLAKPPHFVPKAKRVVFIFLGGGPSQMDLLDPKPLLKKYQGQPIPFSVSQRALTGSTKLMASPFKFQKYGQSGIESLGIVARSLQGSR